MASFAYSFPWVVHDWATGALTTNRSDGLLLDASTQQPVQAFDNNGLPAPLRTGPYGTLEPFTSSVRRGIAQFGSVKTLVISDDALDSSVQAQQAAAAAQAAADSVAGIAATATQIRYVGTNPDGRIWVSSTPVLNGGTLIITADDRVAAVFPG